MKNPFARNTEKFVDQQIYCIYDTVAETFQQPLFAPNHLVLAREFEGMFSDPRHTQNVLVTNPEGFSVYKIGEYDRKTGKITSLDPVHCIGLQQIKALAQARGPQPSGPTLQDVSQ